MKKIVKIISAIMLLMLICSMSFFSYADTNEYEVKMETQQNKVKLGETLNIVVSIEDIKTEEGIAGFSAILNYDNSIFEQVSVEEIEEWDMPILVDNMIQATRKDLENSKDNQKVAVISLKVNKDASATTTNIELSKFDVTDGYKTIRSDGASIDVEILAKDLGEVQEGKTENNYMIYIIIAVVVLAIVVAIVVLIKRKRK